MKSTANEEARKPLPTLRNATGGVIETIPMFLAARHFLAQREAGSMHVADAAFEK